MTERIRVLIADDHSLLTTGLKMIISEWEEFLVVGIASDGQQAVALCESLRPDLVVMDMQMPKLSGSAAVRNIKGKCPGIRLQSGKSCAVFCTLSRCRQTQASRWSWF